MAAEGTRPFQWRPPVKLYDELARAAARRGVSVNHEVTRMVRWALDQEKGMKP